jgi:hypothetical protein
MKCYVHPDIEAIGICGVCGRGLCLSCAAEVRRRLACRDLCEERSRLLLQAEDANLEAVGQAQRLVGAARKAYAGVAVFLLVIGLCFIAFGHLQWSKVWFVAIFGYIFVAFAVLILLGARRLPTESESEDRLKSAVESGAQVDRGQRSGS